MTRFDASRTHSTSERQPRTEGSATLLAGSLSVLGAIAAAVFTGRLEALAGGFDVLELYAVLGGSEAHWAAVTLAYPALFSLIVIAESASSRGRLPRVFAWLSRRTLGSLYLAWSVALGGVIGLHAMDARPAVITLLLSLVALFIMSSGLLVRSLDRRSERTARHVARAIPALVLAGLATTPVAVWVATQAQIGAFDGLLGWGYAFGSVLVAVGTVVRGASGRASQRATQPFVTRDMVRRALS